MILVAIGSNLPGAQCSSSLETCRSALKALEKHDIRIADVSRWYSSAAVPPSGQPDFVNGVFAVKTGLDSVLLMSLLHEIESRFGRVRSVPNAARTLDLDLIDYDGEVRTGSGSPVLPHPRLADRAFVLLPLRDVAPDWHHPVSGLSVDDLIKRLPGDQQCCPISPDPGR